MKRFLTIENNKIIGERYDSRELIQNGEIEDDGTYGNVGDILLDGIWQKDLQEIAEQAKQSRIAELTTLIEKKRIRGYDVSAEIAELEELDPIL